MRCLSEWITVCQFILTALLLQSKATASHIVVQESPFQFCFFFLEYFLLIQKKRQEAQMRRSHQQSERVEQFYCSVVVFGFFFRQLQSMFCL